MKLHWADVDIATYGAKSRKVMLPMRILADPTETMGIYKDNGNGYDRYIVSHIPTGYKVAGTQTKRAAREVLGRLLALEINWRETDPDKLRSSLSGSAHGSVMEIINDYRGR